jgi:amino acid adenylation domain-containing protein
MSLTEAPQTDPTAVLPAATRTPVHQVPEPLIAFPKLFRKQVEQTPQHTAVVQGETHWTYSELDAISSTLAKQLLDQGLRMGRCVGLLLDRSPAAIAAMLGVMKAGGVFVPLDPEYPVERLAFMIEDAEIEFIIADPHHQASIGKELSETCPARESVPTAAQPDAPRGAGPLRWHHVEVDHAERKAAPEIDVPDDALAYIMYTSGSTGKPKGVQIDHAALATYCYADMDVYQLSAQDRTLQFSTLNFDIAIEEIFPPLLTGGCVVVRPRDRSIDANELSALVAKHDITAVHLATAYWHQWVDLMVATDKVVPQSIRLMVVTGEKVSVEHYRRWQSRCQHDVLWCNAYGPTEATVTSTVFIPGDDFDAVNMPIGKPIKRYTARILNEDFQDVPIGETGHLFIGGPALAKGYLNRPDLTAAAFVELPPPKPRQNEPTTRWYRTGDLARWLPNGEIDFAGRVDHQIKLGSYRIEPAEIEAVLNQHPAVLESVVSYDAIEGQRYLIAYVATGDTEVTAAELADFLRDRLPVYMVPVRYATMPTFPKTINGKIDRSKLDAASSRTARQHDFAPPRNETETLLCELWKDVLNVDEIGIHDDFFLLGGSSLLVTQVIARLAGRLDIELPVRDFFANPTIASLARQLAALRGEETETSKDAVVDIRASLPRIQPLEIASGSAPLHGVLYPAIGIRQDHGVLICNSLGHEYTRAFRNLQQLAVQLSKDGFDVLRFDYAGTGNSPGDESSITLPQLQRDIEAAKGRLQETTACKRISAIGIRFGALALSGCPLQDYEHVCLWDPVLRGAEFLHQLDVFHQYALTSRTRFRRQRDNGEIEQLFGHRVGSEKRHSFEAASLQVPAPGSAANVNVILSDGYLQHHPSTNLRDDLATVETTDQIHWHDVRFTESAFSSPQAFRIIREIMRDEPR